MNLSEECAAGEQLFDSSRLCWALQISFTILFSISVAYLAMVRRKCRPLFHRNFTILLLNAIGVSLATSYGSAILFANYFISKWAISPSDPECSAFLPHFGLVLLTKMTVYFYFLALPLFHFCIMCERVRATLRAKTYEKEARQFGFIMLGIIWAILLSYSIFIALTALIDKQWNLRLQILFPNFALNTDSNSPFISFLHYSLCGIIFATTSVEFWIIWHNFRERRRQKKGSFTGYSLSHKFQVNENIVSMQLMLPLDICYFLIFLTHVGLSLWLRTKLDHPEEYASIQLAYDWIGMSYNIYGNVSVWLYIRFLKRNSQSIVVKIRQNQVAAEDALQARNGMELYFNQLRNQWA